MNKIYIVTAIFCIAFGRTGYAQTSQCGNSDFELGNLDGWRIYENYGSAEITSGTGVDSYGGFPVVASGGNYSLLMKASGATYARGLIWIPITEENAMMGIRVAGVFETPDPSLNIPPDQVTHPQLYLGFYFYESSVCNGGISISRESTDLKRLNGQVYYMDWNTYFIDLSEYIGHEIGVDLYAAGGQYNILGDVDNLFVRGYFDLFCATPPLSSTTTACIGDELEFEPPFDASVSESSFFWDMGDGTTYNFFSKQAFTHTYQTPGTYTITLKYRPQLLPQSDCDGSGEFTHTIVIDGCGQDIPSVVCETCIPSFSPLPGEKYVLQAWVKEGDGLGKHTYQESSIRLNFAQGTVTDHFRGSGMIIDGWQRIEGEFTVPLDAEEIQVELHNDATEDVFFDDIRIQPFNSSFKTFVYDPVTFFMMAILDERNYATFYEYDENGSLKRTKKETERGIKTIGESQGALRKRIPTAP